MKIDRVSAWGTTKVEKVRVWRKLQFKMQCISAWRKLSAKRARWVERLGSPSGGPSVHCLVYQLGLTQRLTNYSALICALLLPFPERKHMADIEIAKLIAKTLGYSILNIVYV